MFVQLIIGDVDDATALESRLDLWTGQLAPGAVGWQGLVAGTATQGPCCTVVWFDSIEDARANSDRPEQARWWDETEPLYRGPVTFVDSDDVTLIGPGTSDRSCFVQLMRARCSDRPRLEKIEDEVGEEFARWRPDLLAGLRAWQPDGTVNAVDFFSSVEDARAGESSPPPPVVAERFGEWQSLLSGVEWYDITDPWHRRPLSRRPPE